MVTGPEPKQVKDGRVMQLRHHGEPAEFPGVLHEGEIPPEKGEDAGGELHRSEGGFVLVRYSVMLHGAARNEETRI